MLLGIYNYTTHLTYLNLLFGLIGIKSASVDKDFTYASICLLLAGCSDMFDGIVSRLKKKRSQKEKKYGIQIDSLADMVSFGVLPVIIGISISQHQIIFQKFFLFFSIFYVLATLIRLAYFNILTEEEKELNNKRFVGVPVTVSSVLFPFLFLTKNILKKVFKNINLEIGFLSVYLFFIILLTFLFLFDKIKFKKPKNILYLFIFLLLFLSIIFSLCMTKHFEEIKEF